MLSRRSVYVIVSVCCLFLAIVFLKFFIFKSASSLISDKKKVLNNDINNLQETNIKSNLSENLKNELEEKPKLITDPGEQELIQQINPKIKSDDNFENRIDFITNIIEEFNLKNYKAEKLYFKNKNNEYELFTSPDIIAFTLPQLQLIKKSFTDHGVFIKKEGKFEKLIF